MLFDYAEDEMSSRLSSHRIQQLVLQNLGRLLGGSVGESLLDWLPVNIKKHKWENWTEKNVLSTPSSSPT